MLKCRLNHMLHCSLFMLMNNVSRVDGFRILYSYIPGFGAESACGDDTSDISSTNDLSALCREMMKAHGHHKDLWTAYVCYSVKI